MKVGIIGSGDVGRALGRGFASRGHSVEIGTRHPEEGKLKEWLKAVGKRGSIGTFSQAATYGEIIVLAVTGTAVDEAIKLADPVLLKGKLVIDVTNPLDFSKGMPPGLFTGPNDSLGEHVQKALPDSQVVKCWNTVPNSLMVNPKVGGSKPTMMICGNSKDAKAKVEGMLIEFGWDDVVDIGGIDEARYLESLVALWVRVGAARGTYQHAFKDLHD